MLKQDELDAALAPARTAMRWGSACALAATALALAVAGPLAGAAALTGGLVGVLAGRSLSMGLASALRIVSGPGLAAGPPRASAGPGASADPGASSEGSGSAQGIEIGDLSADALSPDARRARNKTLVAAFLRYPLLGGIIAFSIMNLGLPAGWLAVGLSAWPVALLAAAWQSGLADVSTHQV